MDKKIKLIAIGLAALCVLALFTAFNYFNSYSNLKREYEQLEGEKDTLAQENNVLKEREAGSRQEAQRAKEREEDISSELKRVSGERQDLEKRLNLLAEEKNRLVEKLEEALTKRPAVSLEEPSRMVSREPEATPDQYWAQLIKEKEDLLLQIDNLKDTIEENQLKIDELTRDKSSLDLEAQRLSKEKEDIQRKLEYNEKMADSLSLQLVREKDDKRKIETQFALFKEENYALRSRLKELMNSKVALEKKLAVTDEKRIELYNRLSQMDRLLQDKLTAVMEAKEDLSDIKKGAARPGPESTVELPAIVVNGQQASAGNVSSQEGAYSGLMAEQAPAGEISAKIIGINEENNFVVLDIGENQGVRKGQVFRVWRGSKSIASLEVIQTKTNVCAADISGRSAELKIGDIVR